MEFIDLHTHTTASDGSMTTLELAHHAQKNNLKLIAITDHDTVEGLINSEEAESLTGVKIIKGIELSADFGVEIHILGYNIDPQNKALKHALSTLKKQRITRNQTMIDRLCDMGFDMTYDDVLKVSGGGTIGRVHMARVLVEKGYAPSIKVAFDLYLSEGKKAFCKRPKVSASDIINLIKKSGGIPVLAHPFYLKNLDYDASIKELKSLGLCGIECIYPEHPPKMRDVFISLAAKYSLFVTGGSDFHGKNKPHIEIGQGFKGQKIPYDLALPIILHS